MGLRRHCCFSQSRLVRIVKFSRYLQSLRCGFHPEDESHVRYVLEQSSKKRGNELARKWARSIIMVEPRRQCCMAGSEDVADMSDR